MYKVHWKGKKNQASVWGHSVSIGFGQACLLSWGALAGTGISAGDALAELAAETFVFLEEASVPLKTERKKGKTRALGMYFIFYVMIILSSLEECDTLTS